MSIEIETQSVTISTDKSRCGGPKGTFPSFWRLVDDGTSVVWKIHQDKVNKARQLVYEPARRLVHLSQITRLRGTGFIVALRDRVLISLSP